MRVIVEPYNPIWASHFAQIKADLEAILQSANVSYKSIEHVGSTSVPGLAAKPHIDLDVVVSEEQLQPVMEALERTGLYKNLGELGLPQRYAFHYLPPADNITVPRRSTYVCIDGCQSLRNHLAVRNVCRANSQLRDEYGRVKLELAQREWEDISDYVEGKNEILGRILAEAGMSDEVDAIKTLNLSAKKNVKDANQQINAETAHAAAK